VAELGGARGIGGSWVDFLAHSERLPAFAQEDLGLGRPLGLDLALARRIELRHAQALLREHTAAELNAC
jgi:hypothetical protein